MDVFSRTFLPATSEAGIPIPVVSRHMPVLRRCVAPEDTVLLVARCQRPGQPMAGAFLLLLTNRHLIVSRESRLMRRVQLHLAAYLRELSDVRWVPDSRLYAIELAATVPSAASWRSGAEPAVQRPESRGTDGTRERFWIPIGGTHRVAHVDALFSHAFGSSRKVGLRRNPTAARSTPRLAAL